VQYYQQTNRRGDRALPDRRGHPDRHDSDRAAADRGAPCPGRRAAGDRAAHCRTAVRDGHAGRRCHLPGDHPGVDDRTPLRTAMRLSTTFRFRCRRRAATLAVIAVPVASRIDRPVRSRRPRRPRRWIRGSST
jgi:hypothetical protein